MYREVEILSINKAKKLVYYYFSAMKQFEKTGEICYPFNMKKKKHSIKRIINSFKLYYAWRNMQFHKTSESPGMTEWPKLYFTDWDIIRNILLFLINNNSQIEEKEINIESMKEDYEKFVEIVDTYKFKDELYYDKVYVLIRIKKPFFFISDINF